MTSMGIGRTRCVLLACLFATADLDAQNGSNYHVLNNDFDVTYVGVGAGGNQTASDGLGTWIPGESINGGTVRGGSGIPSYRQSAWMETACLYGFGGNPTGNLQFPLIVLSELNRVPVPTTYDPIVFTRFSDASGACFPLGNSAGFVPYGIPGGSSASFVLGALPSACGSASVLLPNEALIATGFGGHSTLLACATGVNLPISSTGFCWGINFTWIPSAIASQAFPTGGWWHYVQNGQDGNQYWALSDDELNAWQSRTVGTDAGQSAVRSFLANVESAYLSLTVDPFTNVALQPAGLNGTGAYYFQTENIGDAFGNPGPNPNGGFDLGGHDTLSLSGTCGVPHPTTGFANQDPAGVGGTNPNGSTMVPAFGVWTFDTASHNGGGGAAPGSKRVTWVTWNSDATFDTDPTLTGWLYLKNGSVKVPSPMPVTSPAWPQPLTTNLLALLTHEVDFCPTGCPIPGGFTSLFSGPQGGSGMLSLASAPAVATGLEIPLVIGSSALEGEPGQAAGGLAWNTAGWAPSGTVTLYVSN